MISVILCTHNPVAAVIGETLAALTGQQGLAQPFDLVVIDNASTTPLDHLATLHPALNLRVVREDKVGLTHARLRGLREAKHDVILMVDDDNVLSPTYIADVLAIFAADPSLGAIGGKSIPRFAAPPPEWFTIDEFSLGCRDLGDAPLTASWAALPPGERFFPTCSPIGGGMAIKRAAFERYAAALEGNADRSALDRRGQSLSSGGDNDMVLCTLETGYGVGYFPQLTLAHLIPAGRVQPEYLARYQHDSTKTWVEVLDLHGLSPWTPVSRVTLPLRKARAYLRLKAWQSPLQHIRWRGACGMIEGRASMKRMPHEPLMGIPHSIARSLRLGRLAWHLVHRPRGAVQQSIAEGGPFEQRRTEAGRRAMIAAASQLPPLVDPGNPLPIAFSFLSGDKYWHQTIFCIVSLQQQCERRIDAVVYDDGTFTGPVRAEMRRIVPWIRFVDDAATTATLDAMLPADRFPALRQRRLEYPHLRKLTDLHCAARDWTLVLDSDMLFFRRPSALIDWIEQPSRPIHMQDVATAYGYTPALLDELAGVAVPERINVGLYSANGSAIDWTRVEYWCAEQIAREGPHYFQEQALVAMLLAGTDAIALPDDDYIVMPSPDEGRAPRAVLHHYVAASKSSYYQHAWRLIADRAERA